MNDVISVVVHLSPVILMVVILSIAYCNPQRDDVVPVNVVRSEPIDAEYVSVSD